MINKPKFWFAFKALAQVRNQMINELEARFYADPNFGLDSARKLFIWVEALLFGPTSSQYQTIVNYFATINVVLSPTIMD
jgi:hypothetical protein